MAVHIIKFILSNFANMFICYNYLDIFPLLIMIIFLIDVASDYIDLPDKINELNTSLSENMMLVKNETQMLDQVYSRVKAGFNFL